MFLFKEVGSDVFISMSWWLHYLPLLQILPDRWKNYFRLEEYPGFFKAMGFQACHKVLNWLWTNPKCCDRARGAPGTRLFCSGHHCRVWRVVTAGRWRAGWQREQILVTVVRVAHTMSSLSAFSAEEGEEGRNTAWENTEGELLGLKIEGGWRKQQVLLSQWWFGKSLEAAVAALPLFAGVSDSGFFLLLFFPQFTWWGWREPCLSPDCEQCGRGWEVSAVVGQEWVWKNSSGWLYLAC